MNNFRQAIEQKILFILLTYDKELISDPTSPNSFDIIRKHALSPEDFSEKIHQDVFKAILNQMAKGASRIDPVTLVDFRPQEYRTFAEQTNSFLSIITNLKSIAFGTFSELDGLIYKLKEFVLGTFWTNTGQLIMSTNFEAVDAIKFGQGIVDRYSQIYTRMTNGIIQQEGSSADLKFQLEQKMKNAALGIIGGIPIHIKSIQEVLKGFNAPDLIVLGARPSMGKTETGLSFAWESAQQGHDVVFVSIEMSEQQLTNKIVSSLTGIELDNIKSGQLTVQEASMVMEYYDKIKASPFNIISSTYRQLELLIQKCRDLHRVGKIKLLVIDYLQLMKTSAGGSNRDQYIGHITAELKALALELNIPIILLSQLKRDAVGRKPRLEDLRESGNIEQDADIVAFIHRETFYQPNYHELPYEQQFLTEFIILKHRGGRLDNPKYFQDVKKSKTYDI